MYWCLWTYLTVCCVVVSTELQCASPRSSDHKLSITSRHNQTGHWVSQVTLCHEVTERQDEVWVMDVDHTRATCEATESVLLEAKVTAPPTKPGPNYQLLAGLGYYKFHPSTLTWPAARETCAREGAHLLILNSEKEFEAIKKIWDLYPKITDDWTNNIVHIGITDHVTEGQFVTIFGEPLNSTGYVKWAPKEPDSGNTANCAGVTRSGSFYDSYCSNLLAFFCEQRV